MNTQEVQNLVKDKVNELLIELKGEHSEVAVGVKFDLESIINKLVEGQYEEDYYSSYEEYYDSY